MLRLSIALALIACAGCRPVKLAGESRGEFRVVGSLDENTCGAGYPAPASFTFSVELRAESAGAGYWKLPDRPLVSGMLDDDGAFRFEQRTQVVAFEADPSTGTPGCTLDHTEVVAGAIASADDAGIGGMDAQTIVDVVPTAGTVCAPLLTVWGGTFPELPCRIVYDLAGTPIASTR